MHIMRRGPLASAARLHREANHMSDKPGISIWTSAVWTALYLVAIVAYALLSGAICRSIAPAYRPYVDMALSIACQAAFIVLLMRRRQFRFDPLKNVTRRGVLWALLGAPALLVIGTLLDPLLTRLMPYSQQVYSESVDALKVTPLVSLITVCIAAPVFEETMFRRFMLDGLTRRYGKLPALLVSSVLFALLHLNPYQIASVFLTGVGLGTVYLLTQSMGCCMLMHSAYNLLVFVLSLAIN